MQVTVDIPDTLAAHLRAAGKDPARIALDALTLEGLRERAIAGELDIHEAIRRGRADVAAGRTSPAEEVFARMHTKYGIPD
jgi:predicted transcriptional regulator